MPRILRSPMPLGCDSPGQRNVCVHECVVRVCVAEKGEGVDEVNAQEDGNVILADNQGRCITPIDSSLRA